MGIQSSGSVKTGRNLIVLHINRKGVVRPGSSFYNREGYYPKSTQAGCEGAAGQNCSNYTDIERGKMRNYKIGLYEKAIRNSLSWYEKIECAKECGYDYLEVSIDATEEKIQRIFMGRDEKKKIMEAIFEVGIPIGSMSVSALTKYALGDPDDKIREKAMLIAKKSIELASDLGVRTVMIPGYDIYFGKSSAETEKYFLENVRKIAEIAEREGVLVGFETMENNFMNTTGKAAKYVDMVDSPYLKIYPDAGNITNAAVENKHDVCEDMKKGKGKLVALHLKETKPGVFREVPFLTGHVPFERIIRTAWELGVRRYVTELWDVGKETWKEDICFANQRMRELLDRQEQ